jgi:hypothetical protein
LIGYFKKHTFTKKQMRIAQTVMMIRPAAFGFNLETAETNAFQNQLQESGINEAAIEAFDKVVGALIKVGVQVLVIQDTPKPQKPDAIFPNNWFATTLNGQICLYPMAAQNRRREVRKELALKLARQLGHSEIIDWTGRAARGQFLEGTGSMVFDHDTKQVFAALSERTHLSLFLEVSRALGYEPVWFRTSDRNGKPVYHTNVLMAVGRYAAVICESVFAHPASFKLIEYRLKKLSDRELVVISQKQMEQFCGNIIEVSNKEGKRFWLMSERAHKAFTPAQLEILSRKNDILAIDISIIEDIGGGGVRCMVAEIF